MAENNNTYIVDASFILAYLLEEDTNITHHFKRFIQGGSHFIGPRLLWYEVGNGLKSAVMRKRITKNQAQMLYKSFFDLAIEKKPVVFVSVLSFAILKKITFYDAAYAWLSKKNHTPLLTLDKALLKVL